MSSFLKASFAILSATCSLVGCAASTPVAPPSAPNSAVAAAPTAGLETHADYTEPPLERLSLATRGITFRDVRLDGDRAYGILHEISHFTDGYRGNSPNGVLFLSEPAPGRISGVIGSGALTTVDYQQDAEPGSIRADGRWAARMFGLRISHDQITVSRQKCSDIYHRVSPTADIFVGKPTCWQASNGRATMHVPEAFFRRPASEQVVFMSAFLL
jgi:hypothetical protein